MTATIINGNEIAQQIREELKGEVAAMKEMYNAVPGLVTILVGENPASVSYVTAKQKTSHELNFYSVQDNQPADITEEKLLALISAYNRDSRIHGILVQLPLPGHIDEKKVLNAIDPDKDVDGFHPVNVGRLMIGGKEAKFLPCTPAGIQELIVRSGFETDGAEVVVVGRSNIVGKPIANIMLQKAKGANATVTVIHTRTRDMAMHCRRADILIVAAGVPGLVKPEWIKPGACVIDVGVNRVGEKISEKTGKKVAILKGDVDFEAAREIAGAITPVPGGVGPMTITMLMKNTVKAAKSALNIP
jgi:methylenetetrahydrofolate dehydrogenase (NADP+)/methenyltetrahydrofolate cyclohydrolase